MCVTPFLKKLVLPMALLLGLWLPCYGAETGARTYILSVVPQLPPLVIHRRWQPLVNYLREQHDIHLKLKITSSIPEFEKGLLKGGPDFAFMNPYHAVLAKRAQGYLPLVRDGSRQLKGILIVRKQSPVQKLSDLKDTVLAFPAPNAFGASLYMRALLIEKEGLVFTPRYVKTHANVYRHVVKGIASAGGGVNNTLRRESQAIRDQLRVLYTTPGAPPHPLGVHPRVPAKVQQALTAVLLKLAGTPAGPKLLKPVQMPQPVAANYERDYQPLEILGLERYLQ